MSYATRQGQTESRGNGTQKKPPQQIDVHDSLGMARPIGIVIQAMVGPAHSSNPLAHDVTIVVFASSQPTHQVHKLTTKTMIVNNEVETAFTVNKTFVPPANGAFYLTEVMGTLLAKLVQTPESSEPGSLIISGESNVQCSWTLGAVDMDLVDPTVTSYLE